MKTKEQILKKHMRFCSSPTLYGMEPFIYVAMDEFAEQQTTIVQNLFTKPAEVFSPLEDEWRKEHPSDRFVIPDRTEFYKWILSKVFKMPSDEEIEKEFVENFGILKNAPENKNAFIYQAKIKAFSAGINYLKDYQNKKQ